MSRRKTMWAFVLLFLCHAAAGAQEKWPEQKANDWYKQQPWLVGRSS